MRKLNWKLICNNKGFGAIGAVFGAIGSAVGVTGAGVTAGTSIAAGVGITTAAIGVGTAIAGAAGAFTPKASTINPNPTPTAAQTVDNSGMPDPSNPQQLGRAALVYTSGQGVQGSNPSNRYALLGNATGLGNSSGLS